MSQVKEELNHPPKNVAPRLWEKFKALEKRTNEVTQRSTEKRIKHLQKQVLETVTKEFTSEEDKDILRYHDVKFSPPVNELKDPKWKRKRKNAQKANEEDGETHSEKFIGPMKELKDFMGLNDHLVSTDHSRPPPATILEKKIDAAIEKGDFSVAEALSDHLSEREAGEKIVAAIEGKRYLQEKELQKESESQKKRKKLNWGFEPKQRWETKGNM